MVVAVLWKDVWTRKTIKLAPKNPSFSSALDSVNMAENPSSSSTLESVAVDMAGIQSSSTVGVDIPSSSSILESYSTLIVDRNTSDLYKAALSGDWVKTDKILQENPTLRVAPLNSENENVLHVLVGTGKAIHYLRTLVMNMPAEELERTNKYGHTPLIASIVIGNIDAVNLLVHKNSRLLYIKDEEELLPVHIAAQYGKKDILLFLLKVTSADYPNPYVKESGAKLLAYIMEAGFYDVATSLVQCFQCSTSESYSGGQSYVRSLNIPVAWQINYDNYPIGLTARSDAVQLEKLRYCSGMARYISYAFFAKPMRDQATQLVNILCENLQVDVHFSLRMLDDVFFLAAENGIVEIVEKLAVTFPQLLWVENVDGHNILHISILCRHPSIYNLVYRIAKYKFYKIRAPDHRGNNLLHMAAKLPTQDRLSKFSGAALKFKYELQWFKTVKRFLQPSQRNARNRQNKTAKEIFIEEHKELLKEGAEWMKATASSCVTPSALIATVAFASAISVPSSSKIGDLTGEIYLTAFAWADALSLLTSLTSLLMFVSVLTSRHTANEFLSALPLRILLGLFALLISLASMLVAFSMIFYVTFGTQKHWILLMVVAVACLPTTFYVVLQYSLLVDMISYWSFPQFFKTEKILPSGINPGSNDVTQSSMTSRYSTPRYHPTAQIPV